MLRLRGAFCQTQAAAENAPKRRLKWCINVQKWKDMQYHFLNGVAPKSVSCYDCSKKETDTIRR